MLHGKRVDDAIERSAHAGFCEGIFGSFVRSLGFRSLRLNSCGFRLGVAVFLFLLQQGGVGLGALQGVFGLLDLAGGGCALVLETAVSVKVAPRGVALAPGFRELRLEREQFFARTAGSKVGLVGLRCLHLSLRTGSLAAEVGIIEL